MRAGSISTLKPTTSRRRPVDWKGLAPSALKRSRLGGLWRRQRTASASGLREERKCLAESKRRLTPRSSRGPTAGHQARQAQRSIMRSSGLASRRRPRLSSNVWPRHERGRGLLPCETASQCFSRSGWVAESERTLALGLCSKEPARFGPHGVGSEPNTLHSPGAIAHVRWHSRDLRVRATAGELRFFALRAKLAAIAGAAQAPRRAASRLQRQPLAATAYSFFSLRRAELPVRGARGAGARGAGSVPACAGQVTNAALSAAAEPEA